jgi:hypothetical protein
MAIGYETFFAKPVSGGAVWPCVLLQVVKLTSSPLARVRELRLHMLGTVNLPPGGLPRLPSLTHLEFYLPDEHNWGENCATSTSLGCRLYPTNTKVANPNRKRPGGGAPLGGG